MLESEVEYVPWIMMDGYGWLVGERARHEHDAKENNRAHERFARGRNRTE